MRGALLRGERRSLRGTEPGERGREGTAERRAGPQRVAGGKRGRGKGKLRPRERGGGGQRSPRRALGSWGAHTPHTHAAGVGGGQN